MSGASDNGKFQRILDNSVFLHDRYVVSTHRIVNRLTKAILMSAYNMFS